MRVNVYAIFDVASGVYKPFFMQADGEAIRAFDDMAVNAETDIGKHPEDYSLARCGVYDDRTGKLEAENVEVIRMGMEAVAASRQIAPRDELTDAMRREIEESKFTGE